MYKWHLSPAPVHCSDRSAGSSGAARAEADKAGVQAGESPDYARGGGWHRLTSSPSPRVSSDRSAGSSGAARAQRVESSVQARRSWAMHKEEEEELGCSQTEVTSLCWPRDGRTGCPRAAGAERVAAGEAVGGETGGHAGICWGHLITQSVSRTITYTCGHSSWKLLIFPIIWRNIQPCLSA